MRIQVALLDAPRAGISDSHAGIHLSLPKWASASSSREFPGQVRARAIADLSPGAPPARSPASVISSSRDPFRAKGGPALLRRCFCQRRHWPAQSE
eukprot:5090205-Pyramimonas_sp.AAC.1